VGKCVSIHSSRGGTGKTILATNLAVLFARKGLKVALLDLDFRAPSLEGVFSKTLKTPIECWLNDFLDGRCPAELVTIDITKKLDLPGQLLVGLADQSVEAVRSIAQKSRSWEVSAVRKLYTLRKKLFVEFGIDWCIFDTSPGVGYTSVNAAVSADVSVVVTTLDSLDMKGTENMMAGLYKEFAKRTFVVINKVFPETRTFANGEKAELLKHAETALKHPVLGAIPCYCDVLQTDRSTILAAQRPNHPFVLELERVAKKLEVII
jgi:MinD-like ATPase involved in chromosome partitioning or flagellar assembly